MRTHASPKLVIAALTGALAAFSPAQRSGPVGPGVPNFWVRPGFRVDLVASNIPGARFIEFGATASTLYVSRPGSNDIVTLVRNSSGAFTVQGTFVSNQPTVHGLDFHDGWLWFTQSGTVKKGRDTNADGVADEVVTVVGGLPSGGGHWIRSILVTNDAFYTSVGDSGNASDESGSDRQKIWRYSLDGATRTLFASGLRNTEKLRLRPRTTEIFGADHGSDNWGAPLGETGGRGPFTDVLPPDEFNRYDAGGFYGHPFLVGDRVPRLEFSSRTDLVSIASNTTIPAFKFGAHWAPNGFAFASSRQNSRAFGEDAYVALHGSHNSTTRVGYKIERILFDTSLGRAMGSQPIVECSRDGTVLGRPVDCVEDPLGGMLFSDDGTGRIYRISSSKDQGI